MLLDVTSRCEQPREPIAIIGIGCRFPGDAEDPTSFWRLLSTGVDAITEIPKDRWSIEQNYHPVPGVPGKTYSRWGGFIKAIDQFEPECFGISPREAAYIDPQQRLLLEVAWEALEDGGQLIERVGGSHTGVFVGICTNDYAQIQATPYDPRPISAYNAQGGTSSIAANRISYCLNLQGPSLAVDTACSSSLVATHLACQSIWNRECDLALAGGVNVITIPFPFIAFCAASMLSPEGRCKAFDASASGFVRGEGAGMVVLKPLSKALADRDPVYAVILSSTLNQDGRTSGMAMPSQPAQEALVREACRQAGIAPQALYYVEAHGTGTVVGDPIEAKALGNVLCADRPKGDYCVMGSVKTNIGHLEAAAGIAGVIKTALVLQHRMIPPHLHFLNPNPDIPFEELQLRVPRSLEPWPDDDRPAIAGVNSFGFGGTNAHIIMMEHRQSTEGPDVQAKGETPTVSLMPLSARTPEALQTLVRSYQAFLGRDNIASVEDLCYTASIRRTHFDHRLSLVVRNKEELLEGLEAFLSGERRSGMYTGRHVHGHAPKLAFVFPGHGPQWWGMGRELLETEPVFRTTLEACDAIVQHHGDWSLLAELTADQTRSRLDETAIAQPAIFAVQVALAALWKSWGIEPEAVVGHSVGEIAAAHIAGALPLEDAVRVIFHRGRTMELASSKGKMLAVGCSMLEAEQAIQGYEDRVSVAAANSPSSATLSGDPQALETIERSLSARGIFCRFVRVNYAFHSPQMEPVQDELLASLDGLDLQPCALTMISTVTGEAVEGRQLDKHYWWRNVRERVRFAAAVDWLIARDYDAFLELSPHPTLSGSVSECLLHQGRQGAVFPSLRRQEPERASMLASFGGLYTVGYPVDWQKLWPNGGRCVPLPRFPWQRQSYWHEAGELRELRLGVGGNQHPLLGRNLRSADPSWKITLDKRALRYLDDHRVQEHVVFPAAAYVEMVLEAALESLGGGTYILEEIQFQKALFIPDNDDTPTALITFYPTDGSFAIHSSASESDQSWSLHTMGYLRAQQDLLTPEKVDLEAIRNGLREEMSQEDFYRIFDAVGLHYGPTFRGMEQLWRRDGESLGRVCLSSQLEPESTRYCFHPALLDSCLQVLAGAIPRESAERYAAIYMPVYVERVRFYGRPRHRVWSHTHLTSISANALEANVRVYDDDGSLLIEFDGFRCQAVKSGRGDDADDMQRWFYEINWQHKPLPEQSMARRSADFIPPSRAITQAIQREAQQFLAEKSDWAIMTSKTQEPEELFEQLTTTYVVQALRDLGWQYLPGDHIRVDSLMEQLNIVSLYQKLMRRYLRMLENASYLSRVSTDTWVVDRVLADQDPQTLWQHILLEYPQLISELSLIGRCGSHLAAVLRGETDPLFLLFPEGSTASAEHFYQDSPTLRLYNLMVQRAVSHALSRLPAERTVRILEVGAGTGGATTYVLPELPANRTEYVFSDVTQLFMSKAEQKFRDYPFVRYQLLNIEEDALAQGFEPHSFDLIVAFDVLHATVDLRDALRNILQLLSSNGLLILLEAERVTQPSWIDLVFGLTEGWWRFRDFDLRPEYPLLTKNVWKGVLEEVGFTDVVDVLEAEGEEEAIQVVILARGPHIQEDAPTTESEVNLQPTSGEPGRWLMFADGGGVAEELARLLRARGEACVLVTPGERFQCLDEVHFQIAPDSPEDMERLLQAVVAASQPAWRGVIHLWSLDTPPPEDTSIQTLQRAEALGCHCLMHFIQTLSKIEATNISPRLILVTRGAQPVTHDVESVSIGQAPIVGLGRIITTEHPSIRCKMVDLSLTNSPEEIRFLFAELWTEDPEEEVAWRQGARFVPRVERTRVEKVPAWGGDRRPFRLELSTPGIIDNLTLRETKRRQPGPGEVEIEVYAATLNFRDVLKTLGLYPTDSADYQLLGDECAGRVVAVGADVEDWQSGDAVVTMAPGSLGSHVTTSALLVMRKPEHMTFEEAVTMPTVFLTASYALHHLARIQAGERVLIHSAAGGVGLAAVQIAQHVGAEVFATAGNQEKRDLLRSLGVQHVMDSRSLAFADQIMEITGGQGVDIVLNSLAGKAIAKGMSCLAPYGRFLELGKRDIYQNSKLGLWGFRKNASFLAIDLGGLIGAKPAFTKSLLDNLSHYMAAQTFHPLPYQVFPVSRIVEAFRYMAQARHIGKVVIAMQVPGALIEPLQETHAEFRGEATYLITGGLGGFGLTLARWIIEHGGRNIVLMGRSGAASEEAQKVLEELQCTGARVVVAKADVADAQQVAEVLADIDRSLPPLAGIFHAAMVLDDGILLQLDRERFRKVMAPKMDGAWNLHVLTAKRGLDFFVLFSSVTSIFGNAGQGNYVAANNFVDTFAYYRRSLGLPGTTINWGHLTETGYVARIKVLSELLEQKGVLGMSPKQAMQALDWTLQKQPMQVGIMRMDWQKVAQAMVAQAGGKAGLSQRLSALMSASGTDQQGGQEGSRIREALRHAEPEERVEIIQTYIREQVARVLGTSAAKLDADRPLNELGLDSLMGIELKNRIEGDLALSLPTRELMDAPSINKLAKVALDLLVPSSASSPSVPLPIGETSAEEIVATVERLSDEEVDSLLSQMVDEEIEENV